MGNKAGKASSAASGLKPVVLEKLSAASGFTEAELRALHEQFSVIKEEVGAGASAGVGSTDGDLRISAAEFQAALGYGRGRESVFLARIFALFDGNKDGHISFEEFVLSIAQLTPTAKPEARVKRALMGCEASGTKAPPRV